MLNKVTPPPWDTIEEPALSKTTLLEEEVEDCLLTAGGKESDRR